MTGNCSDVKIGLALIFSRTSNVYKQDNTGEAGNPCGTPMVRLNRSDV